MPTRSPNGFHDALLSALVIDFEHRTSRLDLLVWVGELQASCDAEREQRRAGQLALAGLIYCVVDAPDPRYPYVKPQRLMIDLCDEAPDFLLSQSLPRGASAARFFVSPWNAFIHVAANSAQVAWAP